MTGQLELPGGQSRRRCVVAVLSFALFVILAAAGQPVSPAQAGSAPDKLRFSIGIDPVMSMLLVAKEAGIFQKYNIDAEIIQAESGGAALEMTVGGQTDGATTTELPGARARSKGGKIIITAALAVGDGIFSLVANKDLQKPADVAGKRVGVAKGTSSEYLYQRFLEVYKIPKESPKVIYISPQEMIPALIRGDLDAIMAFEPWVAKAVTTAKGVGAHSVVRGAKQLSGLNQDLILFLYLHERVVQKKELTQRVIKALFDTEEFMKSKRAEARKIASEGFRLDPGLVDSIWAYTTFNINLDKRTVNDMKLAAKWMLDNRLIEKEPDWDNFFRPEFLKEIRPDRVN